MFPITETNSLDLTGLKRTNLTIASVRIALNEAFELREEAIRWLFLTPAQLGDISVEFGADEYLNEMESDYGAVRIVVKPQYKLGDGR